MVYGNCLFISLSLLFAFKKDRVTAEETGMRDLERKSGKRGDLSHLEVERFGYLVRTQEYPISMFGLLMVWNSPELVSVDCPLVLD